MNSIVPVSFNRTLPLAITLSLAVAVFATQSAARQFPCAESLQIERSERLFDNVRLGIVVLRGSTLALATDTLGSWTPLESQVPGGETVFRHRLMQDVRLSVCHVARGEAPVSKNAWDRYVSSQRDDSGSPLTILENRDSELDANVFAVTGVPTRELFVSFPPTFGGEARGLQQVFAIDGDDVLVFTLTGPTSRVEAAADDLRFFLARLERL